MPGTMDNNPASDHTAEIRKWRLNKELIDCFKKPAHATTASPSDQGIGFYTHVGPTPNARLLPVGGWNGKKYQARSDRIVPEEVIQVYEELTKAIQNEQQAPVGKTMSELQRRYADLGADGKKEPQSLSSHQQPQPLAGHKAPISRSNTDPGYVQALEGTRGVSFNAESQRATTNVMGVNDDQRRKSVTGGNIYDADRDPRRRGK